MGRAHFKTATASCLALGLGLASMSAQASVIDRPFFRASAIVIVFGASDFSDNGGVAPVVYDFHLLDDSASGTVPTDLIGVDGRTINYNTGQFNAIESGVGSGWEFEISDQTSGGVFTSAGPHQTLDANDAYSAFGLDATTDIDLLGGGNRASQFYVVSNVAFDIFGEASNLTATGDFSSMNYGNIRYRLRQRLTGGGGVNRWGQNAQNPAVGGNGIVIGDGNNATLADLQGAPVKVFDGGRRTARAAGSIMSQAISFQSRYNLRGASVTGNNYDFSQGVGSLSADVTYTIYTP